MILVDDDDDYVAEKQFPFISTPSAYNYYIHNATYYFLGVFKTYFESPEYEHMSLRESMKKILEISRSKRHRRKEGEEDKYHTVHSDFCFRMKEIGLSEVRKTYPEAVVYVRNAQ